MNDQQTLLRRADEELSTAERLLAEVYSIGVWIKADDCSDNRRRRAGLRETDWAVSGAYRALKAITLVWPDLQASVDALAREAAALVRILEPLPDTIPDTMLETSQLDTAVNSVQEQVSALRERVRALASSVEQKRHPVG